MKISERHFDILKDYLDGKINPEDIAEEDRRIILELCKLRKNQLQNKIEIEEQELNELNKKLKK